MREGFDNDKYIELQAERIRERINQFGGKLYLEFDGKLFDDYHASRVLPGFKPDTKISMLQSMKDEVEIVIAINANDIERSKVRGDLGITYDEDVLRLMDIFRSMGFKVGSVVITRYANQPNADLFRRRLTAMGITSYLHYPIPGYPNDIDHIVSDEGFGKNEYIETERPLVVVTAPGPGSGKMATCLSQLYHEHKRGVTAGYAKYETFPIWNLPLTHPVNIAYEAATADLDDDNIIDPFHLEAYGETTVNYNRDVEIFPVLRATMERISGACPYQSPTGGPAGAMVLPDGRVVTGKTGNLLGAASALLMNALKGVSGVDDELYVISDDVLEPICHLKTAHLRSHNPRLHSDETLLALSISSVHNPLAERLIDNVDKLRGCDAYFSVIISAADEKLYRTLGINVCCEPKYEQHRYYHK